MTYFYLVAYFLVVILIQDGVAQNDYGSIWSNTNGSISLGDSYTISCRSKYDFWFHKNTSNPKYIVSGSCGFAKGISKEEYECEHERRGKFYHANLTIKRERSPTTVEWSCFYTVAGKYLKSEPLKIEVRRDDSSLASSPSSSSKDPRTPSPPTTSLSPPLTSQSSSSSPNRYPMIADKSPSPNSPNEQPPFSTTNNVILQRINFTITLLAICICFMVVLVLFNTCTVLVLMFLYKRRKRDLAKQDSEPLELEPRRSPTDDTYSNLDRTLDDGHMYATA